MNVILLYFDEEWEFCENQKCVAGGYAGNELFVGYGAGYGWVGRILYVGGRYCGVGYPPGGGGAVLWADRTAGLLISSRSFSDWSFKLCDLWRSGKKSFKNSSIEISPEVKSAAIFSDFSSVSDAAAWIMAQAESIVYSSVNIFKKNQK